MHAIPVPYNADENIFRDAARRCLALEIEEKHASYECRAARFEHIR